jgi:hypothetical protein
MLYGDWSGEIRENMEKSLRLAALLFPDETWVYKEPNIYIAESRLIEEQREKDKWDREMAQVRILTSRGSAAVFLPEKKKNEETGKRCADMVLDGTILEVKTVSGTRVTLGGEFRLAYKQGADLLIDSPDMREHSVFIWLLSDLSVGSVKAKIAGELKERTDPGFFICYFEKTGHLYSWPYEELKALIGRG